MARHPQRLVDTMNNSDRIIVADLSRGTQVRHAGTVTSPSSKGAPFQLGKSPFLQEYRLIENPLGSALNSLGFFSAVLPTILSEPLIMQGCRKEYCIRPELARSPAKDIQTWLITKNTRFATTASSNGYNDSSANPGLFDERWGGGFIQPIAYKQDSLVKVSSITCVW